jgi:glycosyltransferase involved in cell wall biosynthesis
MSVATLEAMASGLPVVVTRTGGMRDLVSEGENGFTFAWADVHELTEHLHYLALERISIRQMGVVSRTKVAELSWDCVSKKYLSLFEDIGLI